MGSLLGGNRSCVVYDSEIAEKLGVNVAIVLSRIIWSIEKHMEAKQADKFFIDGRWWMYDTRADLAQYSKLTDKQIRPIFKLLREKQIIETAQFDRQFAVRRNWFSVNIDKLLEALNPIGTKGLNSPIGTKGPNSTLQKGPIEGDKRAQYIGTKGPNTSLYLRVCSKSLAESPTESTTVELPALVPLPQKPKAKVIKIKILKHTEEDREIAKLWLAYAIKEMSWSKPPPSWTEENFAEDMYKIGKATNLNYDGLRALLHYVQNDKFWCKNAWSPGKLLDRSKSDRDLRKVDQILKQMNPGKSESQRLEEKIKTWAPLTDEELSNPFA